MKIGAAGFIVPFMFVYEPALLMIGDWPTIVWRFVASCVGIVLLAAGLHGYLLRAATPWERGAAHRRRLLPREAGLDDGRDRLRALRRDRRGAVEDARSLEARRAGAACGTRRGRVIRTRQSGARSLG